MSFEVGDHFSVSWLIPKQKEVLREVLINNGVNVPSNRLMACHDHFLVDKNFYLVPCNSQNPKCKRRLTPEQVAFMNAPDWANLISNCFTDGTSNIFAYLNRNEKEKPVKVKWIKSEYAGDGVSFIGPHLHHWHENEVMFRRNRKGLTIDEEIAKKEKELAELKEKKKCDTKWEPKLGPYTIFNAGDVIKIDVNNTKRRYFGLYYQTEKEAETARDMMASRNRLISYVLEHSNESDDFNHVVSYTTGGYNSGSYFYRKIDYCADLGHVSMPRHVAIKLVDDLNEGRVEL